MTLVLEFSSIFEVSFTNLFRTSPVIFLKIYLIRVLSLFQYLITWFLFWWTWNSNLPLLFQNNLMLRKDNVFLYHLHSLSLILICTHTWIPHLTSILLVVFTRYFINFILKFIFQYSYLQNISSIWRLTIYHLCKFLSTGCLYTKYPPGYLVSSILVYLKKAFNGLNELFYPTDVKSTKIFLTCLYECWT